MALILSVRIAAVGTLFVRRFDFIKAWIATAVTLQPDKLWNAAPTRV